MRNRSISLFVVLVIFTATLSIIPFLIPPITNSKAYNNEISTLSTSALIETNETIVINDLPTSPTNWTWAKDQGICTGLGTASSPYIISELFFNTSTVNTNCLAIVNSRKHFRIRECKFKGNDEYAGIQLYNTTNGIIYNNYMSPNTGALVWLYNASNNIIRYNNASMGHYYGILIDGLMGITKMNEVSNNYITHNIQAGIQFRLETAVLNTIEDNDIFNNSIGIDLLNSPSNNTIRRNHIGNSTIGTLVDSFCRYNEFYENCFFNNSDQAVDMGMNNSWDNGLKGNFWSDYLGPDADDDGIGDIPYNITGSTTAQDHFPLMKCPSPPPPSVIPGYDIFLIVFAGVFSAIGIVYIIKKRKKIA